MADHDEPLPKSVYLKNGSYYFIQPKTANNPQIWHPLGKSLADALKKYESLARQLMGDGYVRRRLEGYRTGGIPEKELAAMLKQSKANARSRKLDHALDMDDMRYLAMQSGGFCALSGIAFQYGRAIEIRCMSVQRRRPWAPSIDRIDSSNGYIQGNVRLVCIAANIARQDYPDDVLIKLAVGISKIAGRANIKQR